jgi:hypothetical protein
LGQNCKTSLKLSLIIGNQVKTETKVIQKMFGLGKKGNGQSWVSIHLGFFVVVKTWKGLFFLEDKNKGTKPMQTFLLFYDNTQVA